MNLSDFRVVEAAGGFCRVEKPHFSWKLRSDERDTKQIKFELIILKDGKTIARAAGEGESVYVLPEGEALAPRTQYEARLTVEDNHGCRAGETLVFETDKLSEPFAAKMIAPTEAPAPVYALKGKFTAKKPVRSARLYATALGLYECYFGGKKAGDSYFAPFWTSYSHTLEYQTYDVTSLIQEGENDFEMLIGKGWYAGALGFMKQQGLYGGRTAAGGSATGNSIIIGRQAKLPAGIRLFGGEVGGAAVAARGSGNTLFVDSWQGTVERAAGFANLHFVLPAPGTATAGVPMLTISNAGAEDFDGTTVTAQLPDIITGGRAHLGETFELLHDGSGAIAKADTGSLISLLQGYAVLYDGAIFSSSDSIYIRIDGTRPNPLAGALTEARIGASGLLNQGGDLVAGAAMREARAAARQTEGTGWAAFATIYGGTASLTTETDVTTRGLSLVTGLARHAETVWADVLLGAFFEAGYGSLATSREVTGTTVWGNGDTHYTGGGLLARIDLTRGLLRGLYVEGSGRAGEVATSWNSDDLLDNLDRPADYDLSTPYYGGHAGLGYRLPLGETWTLDVYGKYLFTHQNGQETGLHGDSIHFDAVDSSRLRLGARLDGGILPAASVYMGAAWEYEYLGTARAASRTSDMSIPSTTMTGSSALFELGLAVTPETAPLRLDLALEGAAGTRRSIGGRVQLVYEF